MVLYFPPREDPLVFHDKFGTHSRSIFPPFIVKSFLHGLLKSLCCLLGADVDNCWGISIWDTLNT